MNIPNLSKAEPSTVNRREDLLYADSLIGKKVIVRQHGIALYLARVTGLTVNGFQIRLNIHIPGSNNYTQSIALSDYVLAVVK